MALSSFASSELRAIREALASIVDGLDALLADMPAEVAPFETAPVAAPTIGEILEAFHERHEAAVRVREDR